MLRKIFRPKMDAVIGGCRRLHNEGLYDLYFLQSIIWVIKSRRMRQTGNVALMEDRRGAYKVVVGKPNGRRPLGRPTHRWGIVLK
jgi:hypothetical protein